MYKVTLLVFLVGVGKDQTRLELENISQNSSKKIKGEEKIKKKRRKDGIKIDGHDEPP